MSDPMQEIVRVSEEMRLYPWQKEASMSEPFLYPDEDAKRGVERAHKHGAETYEQSWGLFAALCDECARRIGTYQARTTYARQGTQDAFIAGFLEQRAKMPPLRPDQYHFYGIEEGPR